MGTQKEERLGWESREIFPFADENPFSSQDFDEAKCFRLSRDRCLVPGERHRSVFIAEIRASNRFPFIELVTRASRCSHSYISKHPRRKINSNRRQLTTEPLC